MFKTKTKVKRSSEDKSSIEEYLVLGETPTIAEAILMKELEGVTVEATTNIAKASITDIFDLDGTVGTYFEIVIESLNEKGDKTIRETFIQEANGLREAITRFRENISYGDLLKVSETKIMGILTDLGDGSK